MSPGRPDLGYNTDMASKRKTPTKLPKALTTDELMKRHAPDNPRDHDIGAIAESLREYGYNRRIVLNAQDGMIVVGHGTSKALDHMRRLCRGIELDPGYAAAILDRLAAMGLSPEISK